MSKDNEPDYFIWETHGVHVGTGKDHVKHGVDEIEEITALAIEKGHPNITFIIHTPRLTRFRYAAEKRTDIKFIRGDNTYFTYPQSIEEIKAKFGDQINIKYGIELEWLGADLGMQWSRSKVFQAPGADFVIGSVHFSKEGIPYDGSLEEAQKLVEMRGGVENYWAGYIEEMIEMVDSSWEMIQVVGHLDLPKLYVSTPEPLLNLDSSNHFLARRMRVLLEMISSYNLAIDVNLAGKYKGCGIYPEAQLLKHAKQLDIPISLGTDTHALKGLGLYHKEGIEYAGEAGYNHYVSFSKHIPEKRPLLNDGLNNDKYKLINTGIEILNQRFATVKQHRIPKFSFGGSYRSFAGNQRNWTSLGDYEAIRIRKGDKSIAISGTVPEPPKEKVKGLFSYHKDEPGVLSRLFNTLASEEINVETAYLNSNYDGTATAFFTVSGEDKSVEEAVEFLKGTAGDSFIKIEYVENFEIPSPKKSKSYLLEMDGVDLPIAINKQMITSIHSNTSGVLLVLLSALASQNINVLDLQLGHRGQKGYAVLAVDGDEQQIKMLLPKLGPQYYETSYINLS